VTTPEPAYVTVARILRPHGRRGEVASEILTDFPDRLKLLQSAYLWNGAAPPRRSGVRGCWLSTSRGGQAIFHFEGSDSISDAEKLVGLEVQIPLADRAPLPDATYYVTDLLGCEIFDGSAVLGKVSDVQFTGEGAAGTPILVVDSASGELLIPLAQDICEKIDTASRRIHVTLPEGLRELNES
jgi:16S rRNA processing protein RimM